MLEVKNLCYKIPGKWKILGNKAGFALKEISFQLESGYLMGLLGDNGAGKTTLLRLLGGVLAADAGEVLFQGQPLSAAARSQEIAYLGGEAIFFENQTVYENAKLFGHLYPKYREADFLEMVRQFGLQEEILQRKVGDLSLGQKKQLQLAFVLARHAQLLLLDEPTAGLDPVFRMRFMEILQERIADEESSVVFSTHLPADIEEVADYIAVLKDGQMECKRR